MSLRASLCYALALMTISSGCIERNAVLPASSTFDGLLIEAAQEVDLEDESGSLAFRAANPSNISLAYRVHSEWNNLFEPVSMVLFTSDSATILGGSRINGDGSEGVLSGLFVDAAVGDAELATPEDTGQKERSDFAESVFTNATEGVLLIAWANLPAPLHIELLWHVGTEVTLLGKSDAAAISIRDFDGGARATTGLSLGLASQERALIPVDEGDEIFAMVKVVHAFAGAGSLTISHADGSHVVPISTQREATLAMLTGRGSLSMALEAAGVGRTFQVFALATAFPPGILPPGIWLDVPTKTYG